MRFVVLPSALGSVKAGTTPHVTPYLWVALKTRKTLGLEQEQRDKMPQVYRKLLAFTQREWRELEMSKEGTFKHRIYRGFRYFFDRIPVEESFFSNVTRLSNQIQITVPSHINQELPPSAELREPHLGPHYIRFSEDVGEKLLELLESRAEQAQRHHRRWFIASVCCLPFSTLLGVLPGPNVFVLYNLWRVVAHYRSHRGAVHLQLLRRSNAPITVKSSNSLAHMYFRFGAFQQWNEEQCREVAAHIGEQSDTAIADVYSLLRLALKQRRRRRQQPPQAQQLHV